MPNAILQAALLAVCSEIGDRTFFLASLLTVWCPLCGLRRASGLAVTSSLVFCGCVLALVTHVCLVAWGLALGGLGGPLHWAGASSLVLLGLKALFDLNYAHDPATSPVKTTAPAQPAIQYNAYATQLASNGRTNAEQPSGPGNPFAADVERVPFAATFGDEVPQISGYGSTTHLPTAEGYTWMNAVGTLLAVFVIEFVAEVGDKSQIAFETSNVQGVSLIGGAALGYAIVTGSAVFIGYVLSCQLSDRLLHFGAVLVLFLLAIVSVSQSLTIFGRQNHITALLAELPLHGLGRSTVTRGTFES